MKAPGPRLVRLDARREAAAVLGDGPLCPRLRELRTAWRLAREQRGQMYEPCWSGPELDEETP